jgi:thiol:disulfide interchange protein
VATPCAGPFLGAALGTALLLPLAGSILVFAALGLGLALPFVVVVFVPPLRSRLPKPGPWMRRLQRLLAIPMGASAIAAMWLLYRQAGSEGLLIGLAASTALAFFLFLFGRGHRSGSRPGWWLAAQFCVVLIVSLGALQKPGNLPVRSPDGNAEAWSEAKVASYAAQGKPAFVFFTADWCVTCKVNEEAAIDRGEVRDAFRKAGVKVLAGDWTNGDPAITRFLESRGRAGVPLYLWYRPGEAPEELPQILTPSMLISRARSAQQG